jgi:hypothetical protein
MKIKTEYEYIAFVEVPCDNRKTKIFNCVAKNGMIPLGKVSWYAGWRNYCFFPEAKTVYSAGCMKDIIDFIGQLKFEHDNIGRK